MTRNGIASLFLKLQLQGYNLPVIAQKPGRFAEMVDLWVDLFADHDDDAIPEILRKLTMSRDGNYHNWPTPAALLNGIRAPFVDDSVAVWDLVVAAANGCAGERERFPAEVIRIATRRGMDVDAALVVRCVDIAVTLRAVYGTRDDMDRQRVGKAFGAAWIALKRAAS